MEANRRGSLTLVVSTASPVDSSGIVFIGVAVGNTGAGFGPATICG